MSEGSSSQVSATAGSGSPRVAVVGVGHMGKHHVRLYRQLAEAGLCELVGVVDDDAERAAAIAQDFGTAVIASPAALLDEYRVDAVSIAVPTIHHEAVAGPLLDAGIACLIEKPLAPDAETAERIVARAYNSAAVLSVGHVERFNPLASHMKERGIRPKFVEAHRISPFPFRSADVSVVLDVMIHDIDLVLSLIGSEPVDVRAAGVAVLTKFEDVANARLEFEDGSVANLTASRLAIKTERKIRCFAPDAYLSMDFGKRTGIAITKAGNVDVLAKLQELAGPDGDLNKLASAGLDYSELVNVEPLSVPETNPLELQLRNFLSAVRGEAKPQVTGHDGLAAVRTARRIIDACQQHGWQV